MNLNFAFKWTLRNKKKLHPFYYSALHEKCPNTKFFLVHIFLYSKTMCPPGYHHNRFVATHALEHMMYCYTLLVPMNQRVLNKLRKEHNISGHK